VWLSRLRPAGSEGSSAVRAIDLEEPVDQEDNAPAQTVDKDEQQVDPLQQLPEALMEPKCGACQFSARSQSTTT
jgi:hypothetical protein